MRTRSSRIADGDEENSPGRKAHGGSEMDGPPGEELVGRRILRSRMSKSNSVCAKAAEENLEAMEDNGSISNAGVDVLQSERKGKRKRSVSSDTVTYVSKKAEVKLLTSVEVQSQEVVRRMDKGKGIQVETAAIGSSKVTVAGAISLSSDSDSDSDYDGGMGRATDRVLDVCDSASKSEENGMEGGMELRTGETMESGDIASSSKSDAAEIDLRNAPGVDLDVATENRRRPTNGERRQTRHRGAPSEVIEPHEAGGPRYRGRGAASKKRALDIARSRAAHFAHFNNNQNNGANAVPSSSSVEQAEHVRRAGELLAQAQAQAAGIEDRSGDREDWPGPWTVARRLVEGRFAAAIARQDAASHGTSRVSLVDWSPSRNSQFSKDKVAPSLHGKCLEILCQNFEHVESLDGVPDSDKKRIVKGLCALRKMTPAAMKICISASPTEIVIPDCTCFTEEELVVTLSTGSVERLVTLELTMAGRGLTDHCLATVCAEKGNSFPVLQTLALRGAYRLVDGGVLRMLHAAPKLKSVDLTQCSLISETSVEAIADAVGATLESLVLYGCAQLNCLKLLPALRKMPNLQRLVLSGVAGVTDGVISELLVDLRFNLQELELRSCKCLTDAGIQAVSLCQGLKVLDLGDIPSLSDVAVGLIADNCRNLRTLRLCRGKFSDTAMAAYVSASGGYLSELSLNCARLVGDRTLMALAQYSKKSLETLDVSFCRLISDQALGLLADSCQKLHSLKLFGCTQVTNVFLEGHSNEVLKVTGIWEASSVTGKAG